ncbi:reverse transcriptase, partial [Tanacetum coccineum]
YVRFITQSIIDVSLASALSRFALKRRCDEEPVSMPSFKRMKPLFLGSSNTGCNISESANEVIQLSNICLTTNQDQDHVSDSSSSAQLFDTDTLNDFSREPGQIPRRVVTKRRGRPRVKNISTKGNELISDDLVEVPIKVIEIDQNLYFSKAVVAGLNQPHSKFHRPDVIFLMETKNKQNKLEKIQSSLCFTSSYYVDPVGCSGGLALWWTSSLNFNINFGDKNLIIVKGDFPTRSHLSCLSICFVYAPHDRVSRSRVWDSIIRQSSFNGPCLTIGDLNLIGELGDKQGGSRNLQHIEEFQRFTTKAVLIDIPYTGLKYTRTNQICKGDNIRERIDRALSNVELFEICPSHSLILQASYRK